MSVHGIVTESKVGPQEVDRQTRTSPTSEVNR
jgi:hypothetical protein